MRNILLKAAVASLCISGSAYAADVTPNLAGAPMGWSADRYAPASFSDVGTYQGQHDTLAIGIDSSTSVAGRPSAYSSGFYDTQGEGTAVMGGVGDSVTAQLYVPSSWLNATNGARRTDMWLVVNDPAAGSDPHDYPIIGFTNFGTGGFVGFRVWDSLNGVWIDLATAVLADAWNTLQIADLPGNEFQYSVNGDVVATVQGDATDTTFDRLLLQAYNFGDPTIAGGPVVNDYVANWSNVPEPASMTLLGLSLTGIAAARRRSKR